MMGVGSSCSLGVASRLWENCGCHSNRSPVARAAWRGPRDALEARSCTGRLKIISSQSSSTLLAGTHCLVRMENTSPLLHGFISRTCRGQHRPVIVGQHRHRIIIMRQNRHRIIIMGQHRPVIMGQHRHRIIIMGQHRHRIIIMGQHRHRIIIMGQHLPVITGHNRHRTQD